MSGPTRAVMWACVVLSVLLFPLNLMSGVEGIPFAVMNVGTALFGLWFLQEA